MIQTQKFATSSQRFDLRLKAWVLNRASKWSSRDGYKQLDPEASQRRRSKWYGVERIISKRKIRHVSKYIYMYVQVNIRLRSSTFKLINVRSSKSSFSCSLSYTCETASCLGYGILNQMERLAVGKLFQGMSVEKDKFRLGKYKFQFGSGVGRGPSENFGKYAFHMGSRTHLSDIREREYVVILKGIPNV